MTQRITCYVVFVTLVWGAHTETKQTRPDVFKSNMTRSDFSNLLSSLIKLNEQRVNVLQKLNRLEEYKVLSEVLRSSDKKTKNGNSSNLYLIVMSKQGPVDAKQIVQKYQTLLDNEESLLVEDETPTEYDDERYELVGLVTLKDDASLRSSAGNKDESAEDEDIMFELRTHKKSKRNHRSRNESKTRRSHSKRKEKKKHNALREGVETEKVKKELKARCLGEIENKVVKCIQACHRTNEDVCSRLACSVRSRRELRKECDNSCRETFVPEAC